MNEHETTSDIIAEMRDEAAKADMEQDYSVDDAAEMMREFACRLEAAYKREKAAIEADALEVGGIVEAAHRRELSKNASKNWTDFGQLGDAAKLREALIDVVKRLEAYTGCDHHTFHPTVTTCDGITSVGKCGKIGTCAAIFKARAALAAPPRNCDLPLVVGGPADNNADKAWLAFKRHNPDAYFDVSGLLRCIAWLVAPATKGGNDAD